MLLAGPRYPPAFHRCNPGGKQYIQVCVCEDGVNNTIIIINTFPSNTAALSCDPFQMVGLINIVCVFLELKGVGVCVPLPWLPLF